MGKQNTITKDYMSVPEHFADCFNFHLFHGEQIIKPASLKPLDPTELAIIPKDTTDETIEKIRDLLSLWIIRNFTRHGCLREQKQLLVTLRIMGLILRQTVFL